MIKLHRLNGQEFAVNADLVSFLQGERDTLVVLTNGNQFVVRETVDQVIALMKEYKVQITREAMARPLPTPAPPSK
ncbi:MAG: flagellar FlbD family protein [Elusimicrobia bacterium]|nr:flagellar FlbD family protein [Elusimicrobiota bacterium]